MALVNNAAAGVMDKVQKQLRPKMDEVPPKPEDTQSLPRHPTVES